jgi:Mor family transcriptional regulator
MMKIGINQKNRRMRMSEFSESHKIRLGSFEKGGKKFATIDIPLYDNKNGETFYFSFGKQKARRIIEYIDEIEDWVNQGDETKEMPF